MSTTVKDIKTPLLKKVFLDMNKMFSGDFTKDCKGAKMIDTCIQGIPCTVEVLFRKAHRGARDGGVQLEPDEDACFEIINVFKRDGSGKHMQWLEDKMTDEDREAVFEKAFDDMQDEADRAAEHRAEEKGEA